MANPTNIYYSGITSSATSPLTELGASQASIQWHYGNGVPVYLDRNTYMTQGPGAVYQITDVPAVVSAFGTLSTGQSLINRANTGDFTISHSFYWDGLTAPLSDASYVFGTNSAVFKGSITGVTKNTILIDGELRPTDDQFDFTTNTLNPVLEAMRAVGRLREGAGTPFAIKFSGGPGRRVFGLLEKVVTRGGRGALQVSYKFTPLANSPSERCFPASTNIQISLSDSKPISELRIGDTVLAFDPIADLGRGALVPRRVTRLFRNSTTEWVKLTWVDPSSGEAKELVATPGHNMLDRFGRFTRLDALVKGNTCEIILSSGDCIMAQAERLVYTSATADMFEQATAMAVTSGALAIAPHALDAWATYMSMAETNCAMWRRKSVPVWLIKKGGDALGSVLLV
jgi:hypothetical protein